MEVIPKKLYAYVDLVCNEAVNFPYFLQVNHQQGVPGAVYHIECFSEAEVDYYRQLCKILDPKLMLLNVRLQSTDNEQYRQALDGGSLKNDYIYNNTPRNVIDGKCIKSGHTIRDAYDGGIFQGGLVSCQQI